MYLNFKAYNINFNSNFGSQGFLKLSLRVVPWSSIYMAEKV